MRVFAQDPYFVNHTPRTDYHFTADRVRCSSFEGMTSYLTTTLLTTAILAFSSTSTLLKPIKEAGDPVPHAGEFYATYQDMVDGKAVPDISFVPGRWSMIAGSEGFGVLDHGKEDKRNAKQLPYWGFRDENGKLLRIHDGRLWCVLEHGAVCVYTKRSDAYVMGDDRIYINGGYVDMISHGPDAEIVKASDKLFKEWTADKPEVFAAYKAEPKVKGVDFRVSLTWNYVKYARVYNGH